MGNLKGPYLRFTKQQRNDVHAFKIKDIFTEGKNYEQFVFLGVFSTASDGQHNIKLSLITSLAQGGCMLRREKWRKGRPSYSRLFGLSSRYQVTKQVSNGYYSNQIAKKLFLFKTSPRQACRVVNLKVPGYYHLRKARRIAISYWLLENSKI